MSRKAKLLVGLFVMVAVCCVGFLTGNLSGESVVTALTMGGMVATALDDEIAALTTQVKANTDAEASAVLLLNKIPAMIATAVAAATAAGAIPSQLQAITALQASLKTNADALAAAVVANTPAA